MCNGVRGKACFKALVYDTYDLNCESCDALVDKPSPGQKYGWVIKSTHLQRAFRGILIMHNSDGSVRDFDSSVVSEQTTEDGSPFQCVMVSGEKHASRHWCTTHMI